MSDSEDLAACVRRALNDYFRQLDGESPQKVWDMVMECVEQPMLEVVMQQARGNQTVAAKVLGISRNTLHKKLVQYGLDA